MQNLHSHFLLTFTLLSASVLIVFETEGDSSARTPYPPINGKCVNHSHVPCRPAQSPEPTRHAYHSNPPDQPLPPTVDPKQFTDNKAAFLAYSLAARIPDLLYQEPCTCGCDRKAGHRSLLDCFTTRHGERCPVCQAEVYFCFDKRKVGTTAADIREGIERRDFWKIDRDKYVEAHYAEFAPENR